MKSVPVLLLLAASCATTAPHGEATAYTTLGGGGGTVTADAPLTGNGSNGSHLALAAGTSSQNGYITSTNQGYLDYLSGRWEVVQERFLLSKIPQFTGFEYIKLGQVPGGAAAMPSVDGAIEGGALTSTVTTYFSTSIFQTPQTGKWGYCVRAKIAVPSAGHTGMFGIVNAAASHSVMVGAATAIDTNKYVIRIINGGTNPHAVSNISVDGAVHDLCAVSDSTNIKLYVDGVDSTASTPASGVAFDEPMALNMANQKSGDVAALKAEYAFIQP